jgi:phosphatidylserine/phosphatidylglycerophosphate/cardiolipin synthase-like enzyme
MIPSAYGFEGVLELTSTSSVFALILRNSPSGNFSAVPIASAAAQPYFSPNGGISARIVQQIQSATSSIDIAIYSFTRSEIAQALIAAAKRGVEIRLVADSSESGEEGSQIGRLESAGLSVKIVEGTGGGIMHNKYAIFDGRYLLTGSYNWTTSAEDDNNENAIFLSDPVAVAAYQADFDRLWPQ